MLWHFVRALPFLSILSSSFVLINTKDKGDDGDDDDDDDNDDEEDEEEDRGCDRDTRRDIIRDIRKCICLYHRYRNLS